MTMNETSQPAEPTDPAEVRCRPTRDPAVRCFIFAGLMLGFGLYTVYDHYIMGNYAYPEPYELNPYLKYLFNHYIPFILVPIGLIALVLGVRQLRRTLVADADGIGYAGGKKIAWDQIKQLDASQLPSKEILTLRWGDGKRLKLDRWKLQDFKQLVAYVEARAPAEARAQAEASEQ